MADDNKSNQIELGMAKDRRVVVEFGPKTVDKDALARGLAYAITGGDAIGYVKRIQERKKAEKSCES